MKTNPLLLAFLVGCIAILCALVPYRPLDYTKETTWEIAVPSFIAIVLFLRAGDESRIVPMRILATLVPWFVAAAFFANGALDHSEEHRHRAVVIETRYSYRSSIVENLVVRSWRQGRANELIQVRAYQPVFHAGDFVTVGVRDGALGVPWISSFSR